MGYALCHRVKRNANASHPCQDDIPEKEEGVFLQTLEGERKWAKEEGQVTEKSRENPDCR